MPLAQKLFVTLGLPLLVKMLLFRTSEYGGVEAVPHFVKLTVGAGAEIDLSSVDLARLDPYMGVKMGGVAMEEGGGAGKRKRFSKPRQDHRPGGIRAGVALKA